MIPLRPVLSIIKQIPVGNLATDDTIEKDNEDDEKNKK